MTTPERQRKKTLRRRCYAVGLLLAAVATAGAWWAKSLQERPLILLVSGDTAGWITPCGCTSNQSGGLLRRGTLVDHLRHMGDVIVADAGGAPAGTSAYHKVKFEAILEGERLMGLDAHNLGGPEIELGAEYLRAVAKRLQVPFLSTNLRDEQGQPVAEAVRIIDRGGRRVALVGVVSRQFARPGWRIDEPREAVLRTAARIKGQYDTLLVLAYAPEEELQRLAAELPEADAVIGGPTGQSIPPRLVGKTVLAAATNKGKFLVQLTLQELKPRAVWQGEVVELKPAFADFPEQEANLRGYLSELGRRDFTAAESGLAAFTPVAAPNFRFAGNQACTACHQQDCTQWAESKHGHAWQTLVDKGFHVDSYCQQCHTTGFGMSGGFQSLRATAALANVGCESCHGPAVAHVENPRKRTPFRASDQCIRCHDHENSPTFDYATFWERIRHGAKATTASGGTQ